MPEPSNTIKNRIQSMGNQAAETVSNVADSVSNMAEDVGNRARSMATEAAHQVENAGNYMAQRAQDATMAVGERLKAAGDASAGMGQRLRATGDYVENRGISGMGDDLSELIRRNPMPAMCVGVAFGFLMASMLFRHD